MLSNIFKFLYLMYMPCAHLLELTMLNMLCSP